MLFLESKTVKIRAEDLKVSETTLEDLVVACIWNTDIFRIMSIVRTTTLVMPKCKPYRNIPYKLEVMWQIGLGLGRHHSVWDSVWFSF